jgi:predicted Rossmann fold nucleotide-binding protein DprA/Smf involved in DNA uptake
MSDYYSESVADLPLFRRTDPVTSKIAGVAAREFKGDHERRILEALAAGPAHRDEIARRAGMSHESVWRRLAAMERRGEIEKCGTAKGESGMRQSVYRRCER